MTRRDWLGLLSSIGLTSAAPAQAAAPNAATPPNDGFFDATASYIGAFKAGDTWATGAWVSFDRN